VDSANRTFLAVFRPGDGREVMVMTEGSSYPVLPPAYLHAQILPYGMINWATRGVFLGERHLYFVPQADDVLAYGDLWSETTHSYIFEYGYRSTPADLQNLNDWLINFKATVPNAAGFRIELPFNGEGSEGELSYNGTPLPGTLTAKAQQLQSSFTWLNHTYTHADLGTANRTDSGVEISSNSTTATTLGFADYSHETLLTGDYSGVNSPDPNLNNPNLALAAYDQGVRYMLVNASQPGYNSPTPNTGMLHITQPPNPLTQPRILLVPRYANNIYYAVTTPEKETDLFNWTYMEPSAGLGGCLAYKNNPIPANWCWNYSYIIDSVANQSLEFLLQYSVNPTMFHMNNFSNYGGGQTVMTDVIQALYSKYNALFAANVPILSLRTQEIGQKMRNRMAYNASGISGQLACGNQITLHTTQGATIPLTGVSHGENVETYAGQSISSITMGANATVVIPGAPAVAPAAVNGLTATRAGSNVTLNWSPVTQATDSSPLSALVYRVYARANAPYFTPTPADLLAETTAPTYSHVSGLGDVTKNYTYVVTAIGNNCWKLESTPSKRTGGFGFTLVPGQ
jgi:hypothetical protein